MFALIHPASCRVVQASSLRSPDLISGTDL
jgi:hypothetical protein